MVEAVARFRDERKGNVAIIFGLSLVPMVFLGGMALDFSSAIQKRTRLNAAADAAALAAVTPAMMTQSDQVVMTAAQNMFAAQASNIPALNYNPPTVTVTDNLLTRTVTVSYAASSINTFAGILGEANWALSGSSSGVVIGGPKYQFLSAARQLAVDGSSGHVCRDHRDDQRYQKRAIEWRQRRRLRFRLS